MPRALWGRVHPSTVQVMAHTLPWVFTPVFTPGRLRPTSLAERPELALAGTVTSPRLHLRAGRRGRLERLERREQLRPEVAEHGLASDLRGEHGEALAADDVVRVEFLEDRARVGGQLGGRV